MCNILKFTQKV